MSDAATIAKGLTKAQRECVWHIPERPWKMPSRWLVLVGYEFERLGLAKRKWLSGKSYITPLGLAVRTILQQEKSK